jgi:uncharacterized membrane protein
MQKRLVFTISILLAFFTLFAINQQVEAVDYTIDKYVVDANILKNGDADVTYKITYNFDGTHEGIYHYVTLNKINGISNVNVYTQNKNGINQLYNSEYEENNTYKVSTKDKSKLIKVFYDGNNDVTTFIISYRVHGLIFNYSDIAELNWNVIGKNHSADFDNVAINVKLPTNDISDLKAWENGATFGKIHIKHSSGTISIIADKLARNKKLRIAAIFPPNVTKNNPKISKKSNRSWIITRENIRYFFTRLKDAGHVLFGLLIPVTLIASILGFYIYAYHLYKKIGIYGIKDPNPIQYSFEAPKMKPSLARILLKEKSSGDNIGLKGDLLQEVTNKHLKINKLPDGYEIEKIDDGSDKFFDFLINSVGDGNKVSFAEINACKNNKLGNKISSQMEQWSNRVTRGMNKYISDDKVTLKSTIRGIGFCAPILTIILGLLALLIYKPVAIYCLWIGIIFTPIGLVTSIFLYPKISIYTQEGKIVINQLKGFYQMLRHIDDFNIIDIGGLTIWEEFLPYAVAFGLPKRVIESLKLNFGNETSDLPVIEYIIASNWATSSNNTDFSNSLDNFGEGDSTGYSGGGFGGGFGGSSGGGDGAF